MRLHRLLVAGIGLVAACSSDPSNSAAPDAPAPDAEPPVPRFALDDVSVMTSFGLTLSDQGNGGPLFSEAQFDKLFEHSETPVAYAQWHIVAARIDPCFPDLSLLDIDPSACRPQLRLVAQPSCATDAALHLTYSLTPAQFDEMSRRWLALATPAIDSPSRPLGVHSAVGGEAAFATALREILLAYAGSSTLSMVSSFAKSSFMSPGSGAEFWDFGSAKPGFASVSLGSLYGGPPSVRHIPSISAGIFLTLDPINPTNLPVVPTSVQPALQTSLDIDNPTKFNFHTLDCQSCHVANRMRARAVSYGVSLDGLKAFSAPPYNLTNTVAPTVAVSLIEMRAFGCNGSTPVWNQRVINESASVARYFNATLLGVKEAP